jgi:hypothetical protein
MRVLPALLQPRPRISAAVLPRAAHLAVTTAAARMEDSVTAACASLQLRAATTEEEEEAAPPGASFVGVLPRALSLLIFAALPLDMRLRCVEVCPAWRDVLEEPSLWTTLDVSRESGVPWRFQVDVLSAASARARGGVGALHLRADHRCTYHLFPALLAAVKGLESAPKTSR